MHIDGNTVSVILGALFAASEVLALIPGVKANSVFQAVVRVLGVLCGKSRAPGA
jgi:hypothetical protein